MDPASIDANKRDQKYFLKNSRSSKRQKVEFTAYFDNYLRNTYLVSSGGLEPIPNTYQDTTMLLYPLQNKAVKGETEKNFN